ncbi:MAG: CBS domain-containing protein [Thermofilaceae archaeon]
MDIMLNPDELKALRRKAKLTQTELARRAGVSQSLIARIEKGSVNPRVSTLMKIYSALKEYVEEEVAIENVMHYPVIGVKTQDPLDYIVEVMWNNGISQVPVFDRNNNVVGTVHERDVVEAFLKKREKAARLKAIDVMSDPLPMVSKRTKLSSVVKLLRSDIPAVLVVDEYNVIGIVTKSDVMRFYSSLREKS